MGQGNIVRFGYHPNGAQRYRYKTCGQTFAETRGTLFYRRRTPRKEMLKTLALLAEEVRISSLSRAKGFKEDTILDWLREAAQHAEEVEAVLMNNYQVSRAQVDALWTYVRHKGGKGGYPESETDGDFWRCTLIEHDTRLRVGRGIGQTETDASVQALSMLKARSRCDVPPALASDGWSRHREASVEVYEQDAIRFLRCQCCPCSSHRSLTHAKVSVGGRVWVLSCLFMPRSYPTTSSGWR